MEMAKEYADGTLTVALTGRLDTNTAPELEAQLAPELERLNAAEGRLVLDLGALQYISSSGLRVLLTAQKALPGRLTVRSVGEDVREVLEITGFSQILTIE